MIFLCLYMNICSNFMLLNDFLAKYSYFLCYEAYVKVWTDFFSSIRQEPLKL